MHICLYKINKYIKAWFGVQNNTQESACLFSREIMRMFINNIHTGKCLTRGPFLVKSPCDPCINIA